MSKQKICERKKSKDEEREQKIEKKIEETRGNEQKEWVRKYEIFTNRILFKKYNRVEQLKEVDEVRMFILHEMGE